MNVEIDAKELERLAVDVKDWDRRTRRVVDKAVATETERLYALARATVPQGTGATYRGIIRDTRGQFADGSARRVMSLDESSIELEYGTTRQPPQPFLMVYSDAAGAALYRRLTSELPVAPR